MSDLSLVGKKPESEEGKEFFLHCGDWWYEILEVINGLPEASFPVERYFYRDLMFSPPTPHLDALAALNLSKELAGFVESGAGLKALIHFYKNNASMVEYFDGDSEAEEDSAEERMRQIDELVVFLKECGGCHARWYTGDEDEKYFEDWDVPEGAG